MAHRSRRGSDSPPPPPIANQRPDADRENARDFPESLDPSGSHRTAAGHQALVQEFDELIDIGLGDIHRRRHRITLPYMPPFRRSSLLAHASPDQASGRRRRGRLVWRSSTSSMACISPCRARRRSVVLVLQLLQARPQVTAGHRAVVHQFLLFDVVDHGLGRSPSPDCRRRWKA